LNATKKRAFRVDARALLSLGRESIKDHTTALVELVKNSYDADAKHVEIELRDCESATGIIRIADDGIGMSSSDIDNKWLRVGYSEKRSKPISKGGRRETGEKGIGRLSADRLGSRLELRTKRSARAAVGISIDWNKFDVENVDINSIQIDDLKRVKISPLNVGVQKSRTDAGTEILISGLRQLWTKNDINDLKSELSTLVPPGATKGFSIWIKADEKERFTKVDSALDGGAKLQFEGRFDSRGSLTYRVITRNRTGNGVKRLSSVAKKITWAKLTQGPKPSPYHLGPVGVSLSFYLRSSAGLSADLSLKQLRDYLDQQGGIRIYRDSIRVRPYGDPAHPEGDWLGLAARKSANPAGAGRQDFRMAANQLVGSVLIGRDTNPALSDSAAREGLIHGEAYSQLRRAMRGCVNLMEAIYHKRFSRDKENAAKDEKSTELSNFVSEVQEVLTSARGEIAKASKASTESGKKSLLRTSEKLAELSQKVGAAERDIEEIASQTTVYRGLATVGISAAVFGHETESALEQAKLSCGVALDLMDLNSPIADVIDEIRKADRAMTRVELWGRFALARVKRDKRRRKKLEVVQLIKDVVAELKPLFNASGIDLDSKFEGRLEIRGFEMDIEALVLNLLTNAYYAANLKTLKRSVKITVSPDPNAQADRMLITVSDSGPGISKEFLNDIWRPLFSTKTESKGGGTGLGLSIVKSVSDELNAVVTVVPKGPLGGAEFIIAIPIR